MYHRKIMLSQTQCNCVGSDKMAKCQSLPVTMHNASANTIPRHWAHMVHAGQNASLSKGLCKRIPEWTCKSSVSVASNPHVGDQFGKSCKSEDSHSQETFERSKERKM